MGKFIYTKDDGALKVSFVSGRHGDTTQIIAAKDSDGYIAITSGGDSCILPSEESRGQSSNVLYFEIATSKASAAQFRELADWLESQ